MAITVDQLQIGVPVAVNNGAGQATIAIVTNKTVAAGALIVIAAAADPPAASVLSCSGGGLTWTVDKQAVNASVTNEVVTIISAPAPAGLASGTTITVTFNASPVSLMIGGSSFLGCDLTSSRVDGTPPALNNAPLGPAWTSLGYTVAAGSLVVGACVEDVASNSTPDSPNIEMFEALEAVGGNGLTGAYRIAVSAGSLTVSGAFATGSSNGTIAVAYKAAAVATGTPTRAFQEDNDPRAFQPQAFQRPDPIKAFEEPNGPLGYGFGFQPSAFQKPDATGAFENQAFQRSAFQEDFQAFEELAYQGDAFQEGTRPSANELHPAGVPSAEAFGVPQLLRLELPAGVASAQAFGVPSAVRLEYPAGISSAGALGTDTAVRILRPAGVPTGEQVGTHLVQSPQYLFPTGITTSEAFGTTKLVRLEYPAGVASASTVGTSTSVRLTRPAGIVSTEAFGTPQALRLERPSGIASAETVGTARAKRLEYPAGVSTAGATGVSLSVRLLRPAGIPTAEAFGAGVHIDAAGHLTPAGIPSAEAFGTLILLRLERPTGVSTAETFGVTLAVRLQRPAGVASAGTVGTARDLRLLYPLGVPSAEAIGTHLVHSTLEVHPAGIASAEAFGAPQAVRLERPAGVTTSGTTGTSTSVRILGATGIATGEAFGRVMRLPLIVTGIGSSEAFGSHTLVGTAVPSVTPGGSGGSRGLGYGPRWAPPAPEKSEPLTFPDEASAAPVTVVSAYGIHTAERFGSHAITVGDPPRDPRRDDEAVLLALLGT